MYGGYSSYGTLTKASGKLSEVAISWLRLEGGAAADKFQDFPFIRLDNETNKLRFRKHGKYGDLKIEGHCYFR